MRKFKTLVIVILCLAAVAAIIMFSVKQTSEKGYDILNSIPADAGIVIITDKLIEITDMMNKNNVMWSNLRTIKSFREADKTIKYLDTLIKSNENLRQVIRGKETAMSFHKLGKDKIKMLTTLKMTEKEAKVIAGFIAAKCKQKKLILKKHTYDETIVYDVSTTENQKEEDLCYSYCDGIMIISKSRILAETSIRQIHNNDGLNKNKTLCELLDTRGKNVKGNLIINYKNLAEILKSELNQSNYKRISNIADFTDWSVLDLAPENESLVVSGFSKSKNSVEGYLDIFKNQDPKDNDFAKYIPATTTLISSIGITDKDAYKEDYANYLKEKDIYDKFKSACEKTNREYGENAIEKIYQTCSGRISELTVDFGVAGRNNDKFIVTEADNGDDCEEMWKNFSDKFIKRNHLNVSNCIIKIISGKRNQYTAYKLAYKNIPAIMYGDIFENTECGYVAQCGDITIYGKSAESIKYYINVLENNKVLENNSTYKDFTNIIGPKSNILYYCDISYSSNAISQLMNEKHTSEYLQNILNLQNFRCCALQYSRHNDMFYTNCAVKYTQSIERERFVAWTVKLDSSITIKPQIVKNHGTDEKEIIVQDNTYKLFLIGKEGRYKWKKQLPEPITGKVYQIDYFNNNKLQYLFATENFLHLIDRNGNYVDNYPIKLPAKISSEISVFDYDNNNNYRIFVPCENNKLYLYQKSGDKIPDWQIFSTKDKIVTSVQYIKVADRDYLIFADKLQTYIINRRGETRIKPQTNFPKSENTDFYVESPGGTENTRFVTTSSSGQIEYIYLNGRCEQKQLKTFSAKHSFILKDINDDGNNEYIFTDNNELDVYSGKGDLIFNYYFDDEITEMPMIFAFGANDIRIGITCGLAGKIYLFDNSGKIYPGFPLEGTTQFVICNLNNADKYNVICGGIGNYLYNYFIQ